MSEPTIYVDITKMKEHCITPYVQFANCLENYKGNAEMQGRMCNLQKRQLEACSEQ